MKPCDECGQQCPELDNGGAWYCSKCDIYHVAVIGGMEVREVER